MFMELIKHFLKKYFRFIDLMFSKYNSERSKEIKTLIMLAFYEVS